MIKIDETIQCEEVYIPPVFTEEYLNKLAKKWGFLFKDDLFFQLTELGVSS